VVVYVTFLRDVVCQKLLKSANVSRSYSQNNTGTVFLRHGVLLSQLLSGTVTKATSWRHNGAHRRTNESHVLC